MGPIFSMMKEMKSMQDFVDKNTEKMKELELLHPEYKETFQKFVIDIQQLEQDINNSYGDEKINLCNEQSLLIEKHFLKYKEILQQIGYESDFSFTKFEP